MNAQPVDMKRLHAAVEGDGDFAKELIDLFLSDCETRLALLGDIAAKGDVEAVRQHAHTIKGAAMNIGAEQVRDAARTLEIQAAEARADLECFVVELQAVFTRLRQHLSKHPPHFR